MTPRTIPDSTISALSELLVRVARDEPSANGEGRARVGLEVRAALRALCDDARTHGVRAEQLVIAIKQGWSSLHGDHPRTRSAGPMSCSTAWSPSASTNISPHPIVEGALVVACSV